MITLIAYNSNKLLVIVGKCVNLTCREETNRWIITRKLWWYQECDKIRYLMDELCYQDCDKTG